MLYLTYGMKDYKDAKEELILGKILLKYVLVMYWDNEKVRSLVLSPLENVNSHLKFSSLCRKQGRIDLSNKTIVKLLGSDPAVTNALPTSNPRVTFAYIKQVRIDNASLNQNRCGKEER